MKTALTNRFLYFKLCLLFVWLVFALSCSAPGGMRPQAAAAKPLELTVLHTNDIHAHLLSFTSDGQDCVSRDSVKGGCYGGVARRYTHVRNIRSQNKNVLLLDAGDQFQGTLFYNYYHGKEAAVSMNMLAYDVMALGNHEFDNGLGVLADFVRDVHFPVVCANIDLGQETALKEMVKPYAILTVEGERVAVVGFITEETSFLSKPGSSVRFTPIEETIRPLIRTLEERGINKIIGLSHDGYNRDRQIAAAVSGLDIIIGGHSHTFLSDTDPSAAGPYPTVVSSPAGKPVLIVTAAAWGKYLGRLDVTFDAEGVVRHWKGEPLVLDETVPEDAAVLAKITEMAAPIKEFSQKVVGRSLVDLDGSKQACRFGESNLGNLITDAMRRATASEGIELAFLNGGGIRSGIKAGDISIGDILRVFPFQNTLATMKLSGKDIRTALEHGVSRADSTENEGTGRFLQISGLRFTWNPAAPAGERIVSAEVQLKNGSYVPLEADRLYGVVTTDYLRQGGDGFQVFRERAIDPYDYGDELTDVLEQYLASHSPVHPTVTGRIRRVSPR